MKGIVGQLVLKDWRIMRPFVLLYWLCGIVALGLTIVGGETLGMIAIILFITALGAAGVHGVFQTIVNERTEHQLPWIMSLPLTIREYTLSKIILNLTCFSGVWTTLSAASLLLMFGIGEDMPAGALPFVVLTLVAIYFAYTVILVTSLVTERIGWTIFASVGANIGTQMALWQVVGLEPVSSTIGGEVAVWNATYVGILVGMVVAIAAMLLGSVYFRFRKRDVL